MDNGISRIAKGEENRRRSEIATGAGHVLHRLFQRHALAGPQSCRGAAGQGSAFYREEWNALSRPTRRFISAKWGFTIEICRVEGRSPPPCRQRPGRFNYKLAVPPFRCYHISVKIKTDDFVGIPKSRRWPGTKPAMAEYPVKPTQDWTQCDVVFNSLDHAEVNVYFGIWETSREVCSGRIGRSRRWGW